MNIRYSILAVAMVVAGYGWCADGDTEDAFTIGAELGAFGCEDLKEGEEMLGTLRVFGKGLRAKDRKTIIEKRGSGHMFRAGRCIWFEDSERITSIGGPILIWGGKPLATTEWFFVRRDDKGTIFTPNSTSKEYWVVASDLDPAGVAEW